MRFIEQERMLLSPNSVPFSFLASDDGSHLTVAVPDFNDPSKSRIMMDGSLISDCFDSLQPLRVSSDGLHFAYVGSRSDHEHVVLDGCQQPSFRKIERGSFEFSPNGRRYAYIAEKQFGKYAVVDGVEYGPYLLIDRVLFSSESNHFAFLATDIRPSSHVVVIDGREQRSFQHSVYGLTFSPDGNQLAYIARDAEESFVMLGEKLMGPFGYVNSLQFSPDCQHLLFVARPVDSNVSSDVIFLGQDFYELNRLYIDGKPREEHWNIRFPTFLGVENCVTFVAGLPGNQYVVNNSTRSSIFDFIVSPIHVSPDRKRLAFAAMKNGQFYMVVDGQAINAHQGVVQATFAFSQDSQHCCFEIKTGSRRAVVIDGRAGQHFDTIFQGTLSFSPAKNQYVYLAKRHGRCFIVNNEVEQAIPFSSIYANSFSFSPLGHHMVFGAERDGKSVLVVDGVESPAFDGFCHRARFLNEDHLRVLAIRGDRIIQVDVLTSCY